MSWVFWDRQRRRAGTQKSLCAFLRMTEVRPIHVDRSTSKEHSDRNHKYRCFTLLMTIHKVQVINSIYDAIIKQQGNIWQYIWSISQAMKCDLSFVRFKKYEIWVAWCLHISQLANCSSILGIHFLKKTNTLTQASQDWY